ncbi:hypothetical protein ACP0BM_02275 [Metamycoplasma hominis]
MNRTINDLNWLNESKKDLKEEKAELEATISELENKNDRLEQN